MPSVITSAVWHWHWHWYAVRWPHQHPPPLHYNPYTSIPRRSYATTRGGVPVEVMVGLANRVGAAPWFNMPHTATDDYTTKFAELVRDTLRPDVAVYVEFSNEVCKWRGEGK